MAAYFAGLVETYCTGLLPRLQVIVIDPENMSPPFGLDISLAKCEGIQKVFTFFLFFFLNPTNHKINCVDFFPGE